MTSFSSWSYTNALTIWPVTVTKYSETVVGVPYTLQGSWISDGRVLRGDDATEFVSRSRFFFEATADQVPRRQWLIAVGEYTGEPPETAERIRMVTVYDNTTFGQDEPPDYIVAT